MAIEEVGVKLVAQSEAQFMAAMKSADGAVKGFGKTTTTTSGQVEESTKKMGTFGKGMEMLKPMVTGLIAMFAFDKVKDFFVGAIQKASDLNETLNKSSAVFGKYAGEIENMGSKAADSMGMSKNESIAAAATFGNLFTTLGLGQKAAAGMSARLVQLAADQGSFNNLPTVEVLEKIRAGITGEGEPLKTLGIIINETTLKQEALNLGLTKGNAPLDAATKAQAAYSLMIKQSANANGDYLKTADGAANSTKSLNAKVEDLTAEIGQGLLPAWVGMLKTLNTAITTFNTLRTCQETMDNVVQDHEKTMRKTAKTYEEYVTEMRRAIAVAQGFQNFQQYTQFMKAHNLSIQDVNKQYGILDKLAFYAYKAVGDGVPKVERAVDATTRLANSQETYLQKIQADDVNRQNNWAGALEGAAFAADRVAKAETTAALAMRPMTAEILLQNSGLKEGTPEWWEFARSLGLVDENAANMATKLQVAREEFARTGDMERYKSILQSIKQDMLGIPSFVNTTWNIGIAQGSQSVYNAMQNAINNANRGGTTTTTTITSGGRNQARAVGGPVSAGWPYMVGERGPEPFIPAMNGYILSKADAERIYASQVAASIPASIVSAGPSSYSYSNANNYNLSVMTSQSAAVVQRSFAIMKLLAG